MKPYIFLNRCLST